MGLGLLRGSFGFKLLDMFLGPVDFGQDRVNSIGHKREYTA